MEHVKTESCWATALLSFLFPARSKLIASRMMMRNEATKQNSLNTRHFPSRIIPTTILHSLLTLSPFSSKNLKPCFKVDFAVRQVKGIIESSLSYKPFRLFTFSSLLLSAKKVERKSVLPVESNAENREQGKKLFQVESDLFVFKFNYHRVYCLLPSFISIWIKRVSGFLSHFSPRKEGTNHTLYLAFIYFYALNPFFCSDNMRYYKRRLVKNPISSRDHSFMK